MSDIAIKFENISKQYRLGQIGTGTLSHDLNRWWAMNIRGKDDPNLKIGQVNDRAAKATDDYVWALRDIDFEVKQGEVLGIIGKNGAGKSTLLKILSRVTTPTTGSITAYGRIASLLEVGTGFHPEMTGRENIYMNGSIMGMTKAEIQRKLEEIVDFSGCERYIDTPVKRYSSGMMVRLGFAIAAHLEPEILVVDEILAVGDAEFQKKAIGKMQDVSSKQGRTVLFVSHNMTAIENLCNTICLLQNGELKYQGNVYDGINLYLKEGQTNTRVFQSHNIDDETFQLNSFEIRQDNESDNFVANKPITIEIDYDIKKDIIGLRIGFDLIDEITGLIIFRTFHDENLESIDEVKQGKYSSVAKIPELLLKEGSYIISLSVGVHNIYWITKEEITKGFSVTNIGGINKIYAYNGVGAIMPFINWNNSESK